MDMRHAVILHPDRRTKRGSPIFRSVSRHHYLYLQLPRLHPTLAPSSFTSSSFSSPPKPIVRHTVQSRTFRTFTYSTTNANMAPIPSTMTAIRIPHTGGPEVLSQDTVPLPTLKEGEILVRNALAGVNFIDTYFRTGLYPVPPSHFPLTLGREAAGTIAAVHPSVSDLKEGDRVVFMGTVGAYANYSAVPAAQAVRVPDALSLDKAAAVWLQGLTAWTFVREAGEVKSGEWVLVHAAAGGVGGLLVQMLAAVGARVIATAGSDEKCQVARRYGAGWVLNSRREDLADEVLRITQGHGVDVVFDGVGKATFDFDLIVAARKARVLSFGNASGAVPPVDILRLGAKNIKLARPVVNNYVATREELETYGKELLDMVTAGKVQVPIHKIYDLADSASAHRDLEGRKTVGKLLIKTE
ncbi:NAD(P)-binding protein [Sodiomyces alkalinus F11]|uniref:Probable quinone oxidoreductase n=1 Tax=Sodiomyces alkalinus (strain CBS 110278 / VKM F-3762 / F11) TaxID=1314773 RepID=A0A3N2Q5W9_SODAK|nr:NAD(P)-binding protein [Sodiomyces alkalinus F11]ROT42179.1 NAD(P)-binding protein [Sodiomyces alkalinus F11]